MDGIPIPLVFAMQWELGATGMLLHTLYWISLALAAAPLAYYLLSLYCVLGYFRELRKSPCLNSSYSPPVSILKPVRGVDREAYENLPVIAGWIIQNTKLFLQWQIQTTLRFP